MPRILLLFATTHGHTTKIAERIAATLEDDSATVDLQQLQAHESQPAPAGYDAVVLGASRRATTPSFSAPLYTPTIISVRWSSGPSGISPRSA